MFCAKNYDLIGFDLWECKDIPTTHTTEELYNKFIENYEAETK